MIRLRWMMFKQCHSGYATRSLRRLEEEGLLTNGALIAEQEELMGMLGDEDKQWQSVSSQIKAMRAEFVKTDYRRTTLSDAPKVDFDVTELLIEKEPITVICSEKGWIRAMKGHLELAQNSNSRMVTGHALPYMLRPLTSF